MEQTNNYGLNQWDQQDRILREDFNADNAKIEAALSTIPAPVCLRTTVTETTLSRIDIDVSDIDWTRWKYVILEAKLSGSGYATIQVNGSGNGCNYQTPGNINFQNNSLGLISLPRKAIVQFFPWKDAGRFISCLVFNDIFDIGFSSKTYREMNQISFVPPSGKTFSSGCSVTVFGIE